ncbi:membrane protein [Haloferax gibbonsii ATCC 33959]|uniref:Membrane protein n=1 Tax=Haloferax gibbonsii (strain ATCC 33959 / DSM 4427 / JCM 8863 / NBRC 102184 / NCIMB 2188 / Ma 2.38) TaxID=1227459 RepID=M0GU20_HALGM|nr:oligosaccharide flippase family protein [Haloferax gibbonsii]ELZ75720.1 membrane protein [Haloferax gibbonsii ATCC 33959]
MKRNMVTAFLSIFGGRIFIVLSSVVLTPLLITTLGFELYGRYGTLTAVFGISTILMSSGINSGARKFLAEDRSISDWQTHVFGYYFRLGTVLAVLTALAFAAAARFGVVTRFLGPEYVVGFYGLAGLTIATQFREYARRSLMGLKQEHLSEPLRVFNKVGTRLALIGIAYLGYEIGGLMVGLIVVNSLVALLALWWVRKNVSLRGIFSTTPREFPTKELFSFNHLSVVYMLFLTSMYHVDVLMLASHVTETRVGYYKSALVISQFLWVIPRSIQSMLVQSVSDLWADERIDQINEIASRVTRYGMLVIVLLSLGLAALAKDFVPLYLGSGSMPVVTPLLILLPGTIGFAVVRPILAISHAKADMKPLIAATGAAAVLNIILNVVLIPRHGILGAAVATTIGYSSLPVFNLASARYLGFKPFSDARLVRVLATGFISGVPIFLLSMTIESSLLALVVVPAVGFLVFVTVAFVVGAVDADEALDLLSSLPDPVGSRATAIRARRGGASGDAGSPAWGDESWTDRHKNTLQRVLLVAGILLSLSGVALAVGVPSVGIAPSVDGDSPVPQVNNTTPVTDTPMPTTDTPATTTATETATQTTETATTTNTTSPPSNTTTTESDDGGGWLWGGDDDDDDDGDDSDDQTTTASPTATETPTNNTTTTSSPTTTETPTNNTTTTTTSTSTATETPSNNTTTTTTTTSSPTTTDTTTTTETTTTTDTETTTTDATTTTTDTATTTTETTDTATTTTTETTTDTTTTTTETTTDTTTTTTTNTTTTSTDTETTADTTTTTDTTTTDTATTTDTTETTTTSNTTDSGSTLLMAQPLSAAEWLDLQSSPLGGSPWFHSVLFVGIVALAGRSAR